MAQPYALVVPGSTVRDHVETFVLENLLLGDASRLPSGEQSLIQTGVIDSTGILELIEYLETEFGIRIEDTETVPDNLDGIDRIERFVHRKLAAGVRQ
jgi:acyl carrier protein